MVKQDGATSNWQRGIAKVRRHANAYRRRVGQAWQAMRSEIRPLEPIPSPIVDMSRRDPIAAIMAAPEFRQAARWFETTLDRSLTSACSQALLYALTRNLKPARAFEIGTYMAGASEAICRGMLANGAGLLHTADPYGLTRVPPILMKWPARLRKHIRFYPKDSMGFFRRMEVLNLASDLTFIDGRHVYEFALFDLHAAARATAPAGFIVLDNISDPGPFFALEDFLRVSPGWVECGKPIAMFTDSDPLDRARVAVEETDFAIVRAPSHVLVGRRPQSGGYLHLSRGRVDGVTVSVAEVASPATLVVQCVLRGHGRTQAEALGTVRCRIDGAGEIKIAFDRAIVIDGAYNEIVAEPWLAWSGEQPLRLAAPPAVF